MDLNYYENKLRLLELRGEELRYNPYHDPSNGRFCSGGGGGGGGVLYVGKGQKGKGVYVVDVEKPSVEKAVINGKEVDVYSKAPEGFKFESGLSGVNGIDIYTNGKSRFGGQRKTVFVKNEYFKNENAQNLVDNARQRRDKFIEHNKTAMMTRYDRPQQTSTSAKRYNNSLHKQLTNWL